MSGVIYSLADFVTGGPILDLPVMEGASWSTQLNRPDAVSCKIDLKDPDALALDLRSSSEPNKTLLVARTENDEILAWGLIGDAGRKWDEDATTLELTAHGVESNYFGETLIGPTTARTSALFVTIDGAPVVNPALNTTVSNVSHGTIGKRLVQRRLAWPGSPTVFILPADEVGPRSQTYNFAAFKSVGSALSDLTQQENGPDFAFDAVRASDGLGLNYIMRHGSEARPRIGSYVGVWPLGEDSPITGLVMNDATAGGVYSSWMAAGRQAGKALISRTFNTSSIAAGYPSMDRVDTSHSDVNDQTTLDSYNAENMRDASMPTRDVSFSVRADASPRLGQYRPGDTVTLDFPKDHPWSLPILVRITSITGDEAALSVKIGCVIVDGS